MPKDKDLKDKARRRVVVEEVGDIAPEVVSSEAPAVVDPAPVEEIKEKVEELKDVTQEISESVEKSEEIQEEIVEAAEKVLPTPEPAPIPVTPIDSPSVPFGKKPNGPNPLTILIPGVLLLGALLGGIAFYQKSLTSTPTENPTPTELPSVSETPETTPSADVDLEKYTVKILNGSGTKGEAGVVKDLLEKAGFKIGTTGNAATYDYTDTVIQTKSDVSEEFTDALIKALEKEYDVEAKVEELADSSSDTVVVIVGSSKK